MFDIRSFFTKEIKIYLVVVLAVAFAAVIFIVLVSVFSREKVEGPEGPPVLGGKAEDRDYSLYDLAVPDEISRFLKPEPRLYREPRERWSKEEIDEHWMDPRRLGIESLRESNRKKVDEILDAVP